MSTDNRLVAFDAEVSRCAEALKQAEHDRDAFVKQHCADNPLSDALVASVVAHVREGGALCCKAGRAWLDENVDEVWAPVINEWAYEALGCGGSVTREEREEYAQKVIERRFERRTE